MPDYPDPSTVRFDGPWTHRDIHANGIRFHVVEAGPARTDAPLVVMLHGFADFWWSWRHQLIGLADAGFRAVAVDLRGYGDTDKPPRGYDGWTLAGDIAGLIRALGHADATLLGHADGGLVCWGTAVLHPRLVRSIALISSPHPIALKRGVLRDAPQRREWLPTFLRYQMPVLPERRLTDGDGFEVERLLRTRSGPTWPRTREFTEAARKMRSAIQIPGVAHSALEYQRWAFRSQWRPDGRRFMATMDRTIDIPVLQIHGDHDPYISIATLQRCKKWAPHRQLHSIPGVGHYAHQEAPDDVNAEFVRFAF
ncbi:alpha/beta fold hydrolase [Antrihabitans cavernicola]|uniref:Alpha/beta hydrolase n=1 Tax=Antrihabitans cavernicola TaxID=2495913 RepID=A0A5A7SFW5_9NOCA|nr:alpha/beta hydrolase [Spelaeibacter cavernicola]KAA0024464.1 alpha/beta hydrolase [Spelaeibacter cavernicola]